MSDVPGAEYLVADVRGGKVTEAKRYAYVGGDFVESVVVAELGFARFPNHERASDVALVAMELGVPA